MCIRDRGGLDDGRRHRVRPDGSREEELRAGRDRHRAAQRLSLIHISEPTRPY